MAAIQFPNNPNAGDLFVASNGIRYTYDGEKWKTLGTSTVGTEGQFLETPTELTIDKVILGNTNTGAVGSLAVGAGVSLTVPASSSFRTLSGKSGTYGIPKTGGTFTGPVSFDDNTIITGSLTGTNANFNGKVGIGTSSPAKDLEIFRDSFPCLMLNDGGQYKSYMQLGGNDLEIRGSSGTIEFYTGSADGLSSTERMRITNLGLGVGTGTITVGRPVHAHTSGGGSAYFQSTNDTTGQGSANGALFGVSGAVTYAPWSYANGPIVFAANSAERMRIDSSGRVLVGTTTEGAANEADDVTISGTGEVGITLRSTNSGGGRIYFSDGTSGTSEYAGYQIYNHSSNAMIFGTNAIERLRIDSSGNLKIPAGSFDLRVGDDINSNAGAQTISVGSVSSGSGGLQCFANPTNGQSYLQFGDGSSGGFQYRGYVGYKHADDALVVGTAATERMRIDSVGKVGIGCTPVRDLQLHTSDASSELMLSNSTTGATAGSGFMIQQDGNDNYIWNKENSFMSFGTNALERMRIDSSGNVGIGTNTPQTYSGYSTLTLDGTNGSVVDYLTGGTKKGTIYATPSLFYIQTRPSVSLVFSTADNERMRIDTSGNVGIGTSSPNAKIDVLTPGSIRVTHTGTTRYAQMAYDGIYSKGQNMYVWNQTSHSTLFATNNVERMRIDSSGNVAIGTASPVAKLDVRGTAYIGTSLGIDISNPGDYHGSANDLVMNGGMTLANTSQGSIFFADSATGTGEYVGQLNYYHSSDSMTFVTNNGERMRIGSSGQVMINRSTVNNGGRLSLNFPGNTENGIVLQTTYTGLNSNFMIFRNSSNNLCGQILQNGTTSLQYTTSSDYRLKENVVDIADGITRVKQLSPKRFNFIADGDTTVDGFIAHEAQAVVPESVSGEKDGDEMQGIDQSKLVPLLTAALQEAIAKIETLEQRLSVAGIA